MFYDIALLIGILHQRYARGKLHFYLNHFHEINYLISGQKCRVFFYQPVLEYFSVSRVDVRKVRSIHWSMESHRDFVVCKKTIVILAVSRVDLVRVDPRPTLITLPDSLLALIQALMNTKLKPWLRPGFSFTT